MAWMPPVLKVREYLCGEGDLVAMAFCFISKTEESRYYNVMMMIESRGK